MGERWWQVAGGVAARAPRRLLLRSGTALLFFVQSTAALRAALCSSSWPRAGCPPRACPSARARRPERRTQPPAARYPAGRSDCARVPQRPQACTVLHAFAWPVGGKGGGKVQAAAQPARAARSYCAALTQRAAAPLPACCTPRVTLLETRSQLRGASSCVLAPLHAPGTAQAGAEWARSAAPWRPWRAPTSQRTPRPRVRRSGWSRSSQSCGAGCHSCSWCAGARSLGPLAGGQGALQPGP